MIFTHNNSLILKKLNKKKEDGVQKNQRAQDTVCYRGTGLAVKMLNRLIISFNTEKSALPISKSPPETDVEA